MQSTQPSNNQRKYFKGAIGSLVIAVILLAATAYISLNRQYILDVIHFWSYQPTQEVESIVERAGLNDAATFTFYATRPEVDTSEKFNGSCDRKEEGMAILGCYVNDRIYIYNVTDERLDGIKEVTASHEMLHAVYTRLSDSDKEKVNQLIEVEYKKLASDPEFADRMAFYARTEPGERDNELHSIIGTEVRNVSAELEAHYAKYFEKRTIVLDLFNGYNSIFIQLDKEAKTITAQLDSLSAKIDADLAQYNADIKALNESVSDFNKRAEAGNFSSQAAFNNERSALQRRVEVINGQRASVNASIAKYESLRVKYNETVTQSHTLYKSIDSTLATAPEV